MNIVVYCSSQENIGEEYEETARVLGKWIGESGHTLVYGGVKAGMMHLTAKETHQHKGKIVGIIPEIFKERGDTLCDETILSCDLSERKALMHHMGDIFVVLPGGLGTIDEWLSTISEMKVNKDTKRKVIVANINGLFDATINQITDIAVSKFANGDKIDELSIIVGNSNELISKLNELTS